MPKTTPLFYDHESRQQPLTRFSTRSGMRAVEEGVLLLFAMYVAYLVIFGFAPFKPIIETSASFTELYERRFEGIAGITAASNWDIWTNIVLFIPYGILFIGIPAVSAQPWWAKILLAGGSAGLLSFTVEVGQLWLRRAPSVVDVVCNTTGTLAGAIGGIATYRRLLRRVEQVSQAFRLRSTSAALLGGYVLALSLVLALPMPLSADFINWNAKLHLLIGNEGTLDRPWLGEIYLVAIYNRALNDEEVYTNFTAGPSLSGIPNRVRQGLVVLYDFSEGEGLRVHDRAGAEDPVDLRIHDPDHVRWLSPNGLAVEKETVLASQGPARKLSAGRFSAHSELTVEVWVAPADLSQGGPARILSYSKDPYHRNFTLAQQGGDIVFRLRTPVSGLNGMHPELRTRDQPLAQGVQHLLARYHDGAEVLYRDGVEQAAVALRPVAPIEMIQGVLGQEFQWPVLSVVMFPLGFLSYLFCYARYPPAQAIWFALLTALAAYACMTAVNLLTARTPFDPFSLLVSAGTVIISILIAVRFTKINGLLCQCSCTELARERDASHEIDVRISMS